MKKYFLPALLILCLCVVAMAGCGDEQAGSSEGGPGEVQVLRLAEKLEFEPQALALYGAYFLNDEEYLLYGDFAVPEGRQGLLFRLQGEELQQLCIWPEREFFEYTDYLQPYFLAGPGVCVIVNQARHEFFLYDTADGSTSTASLPGALSLTSEDMAFWLEEGRYLLCRLQVDPEEPQRINTAISLYNANSGTEQYLTEFSGGLLDFLPPDAERDSWLLLSNYGELCEIACPAADGGNYSQARQYSCPELWPTAEPWLYYQAMLPVRESSGQYLALQVCCESGNYYQVVDLQPSGGLLGEYKAGDENGGGLLAAQGDKVYFSEYYVQQEDYCRIFAWNYQTGSREQLLGTAAANLKQDDMWGLGSGALSPAYSRLLMLSWGNVISLPLQ